MRIALWFLALIPLVNLNVAIPCVGPPRRKAEQATERELQEVATAPEALKG